MTPTQRGLILVGIIMIAALLAFPLRGTIYEIVVIPIAYIAWNLDLLYRSFSQGTWWSLIIFIVLFVLIFSLLPKSRSHSRVEQKVKPAQGQVESLAIWLGKAEKGIYFKWLVANRLGKLAYQILLHRESGRPRSVFMPLLGADWEPRKELQQYLETGLHRSFADFPNAGRLSTPPPTPLDLNVAEAVDFLEAQVGNK
ncbi:MAG TPA: hypothetical protein VJ830_03155 [Anaerolineales bacterium]|nr:hypothetical protein [Anaerolineales bacterium]